MKLIPLSNSKKMVLVDDEDYPWLAEDSWRINGDGYVKRAVRNSGVYRDIFLHRVVMNCQKGKYVDHRNHNLLDNQKSNLRICSWAENIRNRLIYKRPTSPSKLKGAHFSKRNRKWSSCIAFKRKQYWLGYFANAKEAAEAYDQAASQLHGEFAFTNKTSHA